jgi:AraC-like DNA-binding protein
MPRRRPSNSSELHFPNTSSPLGRITRCSFGLHQLTALEEPRTFGQFAIVYIVDGRGKYADAGGIRKALGPGDLIIVFPDIAHFYNPLPGGWLVSYICFQGPVFDLWRSQGLLNPRKPIQHAEPIAQWNHRIEFVLDPTGQPGLASSLLEICRLQQLLAEIIGGAGRKVTYQAELQWLQRASALIDAGLSGPARWEKVARQLGLSSESFRKRFTRLAGQPPVRYRMERLIEHACALMRNPALRDRQIAEALGFCDEFYFSRRFKDITGLSPRQFRANPLLLQNSGK